MSAFRRAAALLAALLVAAAGHLGAAEPRVVVDDPNTPVTYECLVPGPTFGDAAPAAAGGAADRAAAFAAAVSAAEPRLRALGAEVTGSYGRQVSTLMTPKQARKAKASGACQAIYRSVIVRPTPPVVLPEPTSEQQADAGLAATAAAAAAAAPAPYDQGVKAMGIDAVRALRPDLLGAGVKIGIISDSYFGTCTRDTCTFPPNCGAVRNATVVKDYASGIDEGRAMAELICNVAPQAQLFYHTGFGGAANFASGIRTLASLGCRVIVDDIRNILEPLYSPGVIAQAVEEVHAQGVAYFTSVGNYAGDAWEGVGNWIEGPSYVRGPASYQVTFPNPPNGTTFLYHDFGTASRYLLAVKGNSSAGDFVLHWDEADLGSTFGLRSPDSNLELLICTQPQLSGWCFNVPTNNIQSGSPVERLRLGGVTGATLYVAVRLVSTTRTDPINVKLFPYGCTVNSGQGDIQKTSTSAGQANAQGAMAVGAAFYQQTPAFNGGQSATPEYFSSWGGQRLFLNAQGERLPQPLDLKKPDIVAPDGTDTTFFYPYSPDPEANGRPNFFGTSAAAPHAAAVAALMRQRWPSLQPKELYERMRGTALDMLTPGYDVVTGPGYIDGARLLLGCSAANVGSPCDDGNACTSDDTCQANFACVGKPVTCAAPNSCQAAVACDPMTGCTYSLKPDGISCVSNGNVCSLGTCSSGACMHPRAAPEGTPCDDGDRCTSNDKCTMVTRAAGKCSGTRNRSC